MAPLSKTLALTAVLAAFTSAAPMNKRGVVYETVTDVVWTTVDTTITLYPGEPTPTATEVITTPTAIPATSATPTTTTSAIPAPAAPESSSSSTEAAPQPTTTPAPVVTVAPPEPTTSSSSSTTSVPAPSSTSSSGGSSSGQCSESSPCSGRGTYYDTADTSSNPSFCDTTNDGLTENVVALSSDIMSQSLCGKTITATYNGKTSTAKVVDKCPSCGSGSIDMSRSLFGDLADLSLGVLTVDWYFN